MSEKEIIVIFIAFAAFCVLIASGNRSKAKQLHRMLDYEKKMREKNDDKTKAGI